MQNNPQNSKPFYSFCDIQRDSKGERYFGVMEGSIHNYSIGPATRRDGSPVVNNQGIQQTVANFSVRLSNVAKTINFSMGDYNPQTKQSTPILNPEDETTFINVECWDERIISRLQSAGVKEKDRLILTGSLTKTFNQEKGRYNIRLRLSNFKITKRSDVQASTGDVAGGQAVYGGPQTAPANYGVSQPGMPTQQPAYTQPGMPAQQPAMPQQPAFNQQPAYAQPGMSTQQPVMPQQPGMPAQQPAFNQQPAYAQPGMPTQPAYPAQPDFAQAINISDEDLPF